MVQGKVDAHSSYDEEEEKIFELFNQSKLLQR